MSLRQTGKLYPANTSSVQTVEVVFSELDVEVIAANGSTHYVWSDIQVSERLGRLAIKLTLPDHSLLELEYSDELNQLLKQASPQGAFLAALENHKGIVAGMLIALPLILWAGYMWLVPLIASNAAERIPDEWKQRLGEQTLVYLDRHLTSTSELDDDEFERVKTLWRRLSIGDEYQLELRAAPDLGANALALPGGTVVLTDDLVRLLDNDAELTAVIGHELGHIDHDHMTTNLLQSAVLVLVANWIFGDIGGLAEFTLTVGPSAIGQLAYTRKLEAEADQAAVEFLRLHNLPPGCIGSSLRKLINAAYDSDDESGPTDKEPEEDDGLGRYLRTHPYVDERIAAIGGERCESE